jgi:hypothetical protein
MILRQFEIWKAKPPGFEHAHWFVIISSNERCLNDRFKSLNGLACFTLRGEALKTDVRLNGADGFERPTICQCDYFFPYRNLHCRRNWEWSLLSASNRSKVKSRNY